MTVHEPGLEGSVRDGLRSGHLRFATDPATGHGTLNLIVHGRRAPSRA